MIIEDLVYVYKLEDGDKLAWHSRYHAHEDMRFEIHVFLEGNGSIVINKSRFLIEGNRNVLVKPWEFHSILSDAVQRPLTYYAILFWLDLRQEGDRKVLSIIDKPRDAKNRLLSIEPRDHFLVEELYHLSRENHPFQQETSEYLLKHLIYRWYGQGGPDGRDPEGNHPAVDKYTSQKALAIMEKSIHKKLILEDIAWKLGLSPEHFIRVFHKELGMSPMQYFTRLKIEAASAVLVESTDTIETIADNFGFKNPFHFSRIFKKCTGLSPSRYRRTYPAPQDKPPVH
jgi:AraC-like DNA-binding protein